MQMTLQLKARLVLLLARTSSELSLGAPKQTRPISAARVVPAANRKIDADKISRNVISMALFSHIVSGGR